MNIGIFDSGIGGMTLLHQALVLLPNEDYIFYADTDHVPYGTKSKETVMGYVDEVMRFMVANDCKAVVIACNTATAVAVEAMREKYSIPIIGIEPAVKPAVENCQGKRVLVVATPLSVKEVRLQRLVERVDDDHLVDLQALPGLVEFAERGEFESDDVSNYLREQFASYDLKKYKELVLGCTHFNYFKDTFRTIIPKDMSIVDGSLGTVKQLARVLDEKGQLNTKPIDENKAKYNLGIGDSNVKYYRSGRAITDNAELEYMKSLHKRLEKMRLL